MQFNPFFIQSGRTSLEEYGMECSDLNLPVGLGNGKARVRILDTGMADLNPSPFPWDLETVMALETGMAGFESERGTWKEEKGRTSEETDFHVQGQCLETTGLARSDSNPALQTHGRI